MAWSALRRMFGAKASRTPPFYAELWSIPTRDLPPELKLKEASTEFSARQEAIQRDLLEGNSRPANDAPLFTELMSADRRSVVTVTLPEGRQCLTVFSSMFRAIDYLAVVAAGDPKVGYLVSSPRELHQMLRDIERAGIRWLALDRCPRCQTFTVIETGSLETVESVLTAWSISKSTELARLELYRDHAVELARAGEFRLAKEVALETVGHVSGEAPDIHLLLGELGIALGDPALIEEARQSLRWLKSERWERKLNELVESKSPAFEYPV